MLALRGTHAHRAIALEQLAGIESLLRRVFQVLDLQILVEVDEVLALRVIDDGKAMRGTAGAARDELSARHAESGMRRGLRSRTPAVGQARLGVVDPVEAPG